MGWRVTAQWYRISFLGDENVLEPDRSDALHNIVNALNSSELDTLKWFT